MKGKMKSPCQPSRKLKTTFALIAAIFLAIATSAAAQTFTPLASFNESTSGGEPQALTQGLDGNFYGTAVQFGAAGFGTVFSVTPAGQLTVLHSFCSTCFSGFQPETGVVLATDGNFYGTTSGGGAHSYGTAYSITSAGKLKVLYSFCSLTGCADGAEPKSLIQAADGTLYGTTWAFGTNSPAGGTFFRMTVTGQLTTLYSFCALKNCADGGSPDDLIQATDGNFYGITYTGGANGYGTLFRMTPDGNLTTLYNWCSQTNCADGEEANHLLQANDGNLYGTTFGSASTSGSVFKFTPARQFTTLYSFCSQTNCADGSAPRSLLQATDGNLYGTTQGGGNGNGTLFKLSLAGQLSTLYDFCSQAGCADGAEPAALIQATTGSFYGTTLEGGNPGCADDLGCGTAFSLSTGLGPFVSFIRNSGKVGWKAEILGQGFTGTTAVSFDGIPTTFSVLADTFLTAVVPAGATTGSVTVSTPGGTLTSNVPFQVRP